ncbi:MAG: hypothetical protein ACK421_11850 [Pseudanabaenaceae cyanobacterium]
MKIFTVSSLPIGDILCQKANASFHLVQNVSPLVFEVVEGGLQFYATITAN